MVGMGKEVPHPNDPGEIGDALVQVRINVSSDIESLPYDLKLTLDRRLKQFVLVVLIEGLFANEFLNRFGGFQSIVKENPPITRHRELSACLGWRR